MILDYDLCLNNLITKKFFNAICSYSHRSHIYCDILESKSDEFSRQCGVPCCLFFLVRKKREKIFYFKKNQTTYKKRKDTFLSNVEQRKIARKKY